MILIPEEWGPIIAHEQKGDPEGLSEEVQRAQSQVAYNVCVIAEALGLPGLDVVQCYTTLIPIYSIKNDRTSH